MGLHNYDNHHKTAQLKPRSEAMFTDPSPRIRNYDTNVYDLIKSDIVDLHIADIGPRAIYGWLPTLLDVWPRTLRSIWSLGSSEH
ncbi:hypothetical protein ACRE_088970 [Hapsidospora chrysogenum ATCC 11550]|uniref:Uncharacterized protein n=1 Tax=Hapsidospora chrysogenum (strain ATCC 11550 / CBS 779.69 / DSM 880 / IAM 14645 / JCM 23072 / IMI 49137) TaxID=857340 RepID=A0A086STK3_HAPC1|nr:hypothetical protein ACRE_088970 [Hapsidospora chrysogenum ATCC 11550]